MAMDSKMSFLRKVEVSCADKLTVTDMTKLMGIISDILQGFRMEEFKRIRKKKEDDLLNSFVASMKVQGRSEKTIERYQYIIGKFMAFAKTETRSVTVYHIRRWIAAEKERGIQDSTLESNRQVLSSYFGWLHREGLIEKNPVVNVGVIKVAKRQRHIYTDVDLAKLNLCCETQRDRAILHFLRSTGCRISEMTSLDRDMVDLDALECIVHGKGNKERAVYLDAVAGMELRRYLENRKDRSRALFAGKGGKRLEPGGVRIMLKKLGEASGVDHVHPHRFRRTLATGLARHGMPIQEVATLLGHEKIDTTMRYINVDRDDTKYTYRRFA